jgi:hypothetical protein
MLVPGHRFVGTLLFALNLIGGLSTCSVVGRFRFLRGAFSAATLGRSPVCATA